MDADSMTSAPVPVSLLPSLSGSEPASRRSAIRSPAEIVKNNAKRPMPFALAKRARKASTEPRVAVPVNTATEIRTMSPRMSFTPRRVGTSPSTSRTLCSRTVSIMSSETAAEIEAATKTDV